MNIGSNFSRFKIDAWVDPCVNKIDHKRHNKANQCENIKIGKHHGIVAVESGFIGEIANPIEREDLLTDAKFETLAARCENGDEINSIVGDWCKRHPAAEIELLCLEADVPFARTYSVKDMCEDPHIATRRDIEQVYDPVIGPVHMQGVYPRFSRTPGSIRSGAPRLGQHNDDVYGGLLGLSDEEISELRTAKVI